MNPDFVLKEKRLIIELFGDYWHKPEDEQQRTKCFSKYGWKTLIIWEHDIQDTPGIVVEKCIEFTMEN